MNTRIHVGIGGWTFEPWRDNFYPAGLAHSKELNYASRQVTAIEVNGTFYSTFGASTFAKWRDETPEHFVFSLKAHRFTTHRRDLGTAEEGVQRFVNSGLAELGDKLGPLLWQLMPTTQFVPENIEAFLKLLPREVAGRPLRHVIDARHPSFSSEAYLDLLQKHSCTTVYTDSDKFPSIPHARSDLAYLRLMRSSADCATGYRVEDLQPWVTGARQWVQTSQKHEAFVFFINGAKERAPAAAMSFLQLL
ncbi:DUF72 domain-containing protein [Ramlibacter sp. G-1-2-2]|uniref:DUF72 domain-containing protein n=1 Tax=Ramlibacter agri TaxID=2728837 RepID=A0A848GZ23_9BURK|nr:DUF72 domain-containing protein [Ramlibacter agri]NML42562.1 DUF72 domain-containing protein [Ramlibacter agri]